MNKIYREAYKLLIVKFTEIFQKAKEKETLNGSIFRLTRKGASPKETYIHTIEIAPNKKAA